MARRRTSSGRRSAASNRRLPLPRLMPGWFSYRHPLVRALLKTPRKVSPGEFPLGKKRALDKPPWKGRPHAVPTVARRWRHTVIDRGETYAKIRIVPAYDPLAKKRKGYGSLKTVLRRNIGAFKPEETIICVDRAQRKEVLFATGQGGRPGRQKPHRKPSDIRC